MPNSDRFGNVLASPSKVFDGSNELNKVMKAPAGRDKYPTAPSSTGAGDHKGNVTGSETSRQTLTTLTRRRGVGVRGVRTRCVVLMLQEHSVPSLIASMGGHLICQWRRVISRIRDYLACFGCAFVRGGIRERYCAGSGSSRLQYMGWVIERTPVRVSKSESRNGRQ